MAVGDQTAVVPENSDGQMSDDEPDESAVSENSSTVDDGDPVRSGRELSRLVPHERKCVCLMILVGVPSVEVLRAADTWSGWLNESRGLNIRIFVLEAQSDDEIRVRTGTVLVELARRWLRSPDDLKLHRYAAMLSKWRPDLEQRLIFGAFRRWFKDWSREPGFWLQGELMMNRRARLEQITR